MLIHTIPTVAFAANCYILAANPAGQPQEVLVVDPGAGATLRIRQELERHNYTVGAVLATHGHPDHIWDCAAIAGAKPVYVPQPDAHRFADPLAGLGPMRAVAEPQFATPWRKPQQLIELTSTDPFTPVPGIEMRMIPAPGHTEGSSLFFFNGPLTGVDGPLSDAPLAACGGDVIFAGGIGRTDLPGGDDRQMLHTLRTLANTVDPATYLLPGHGPATTMAAELESNPYLRQARFAG